MREYSSKLVDIAENHAREIAVRWYFDVIKNPRTPSYHYISEQDALPQAEEFYHHFRAIFLSEKPYETAYQFFSRYAEARYRDGIPSSEAIYVLVLMRRHIWLYSDFHITFVTADERRHAIESLNRMMLIFDYAVHVITAKYEELVRQDLDKKFGMLNFIRMTGALEKFKSSIMAFLLFAAGAMVFYYHALLKTDVSYSYAFYIPIVLAAIWWGRKGISIAVALGVYLMFSSYLFMNNAPLMEDVARTVIFVAVAAVISLLSEGLQRVEVAYTNGKKE
ncbi:MAG: hypothetical protein NTV99_12785 [Deltaproteobacteria bacterium]|nr:hypothetical protein [Deltaproteobacteria bacterium]